MTEILKINEELSLYQIETQIDIISFLYLNLGTIIKNYEYKCNLYSHKYIN